MNYWWWCPESQIGILVYRWFGTATNLMKLSSFSPRNLREDVLGIQDLTRIPYYEVSNLSDYKARRVFCRLTPLSFDKPPLRAAGCYWQTVFQQWDASEGSSHENGSNSKWWRIWHCLVLYCMVFHYGAWYCISVHCIKWYCMVWHCTIAGFGARAVSRKTPIYFILVFFFPLITNI